MSHNKTLWIVNHFAHEPGSSGGTRHYSLGKYLCRQGWRVCIIASSVELNTDRQRIPGSEWCRTEEFNGVTFRWIKSLPPKGRDEARIAAMISFAGSALIPSSVKHLPKPDIVIGSSVHPLAALAGELLARRFGAKFIFEARDLWPLTLIEFSRLKPRSFVARALWQLERYLVNRAVHIISPLPLAGDYFSRYGKSGSEVTWLPNAVDLEEYPDEPPEGASEGFHFYYFGAHGVANSLDTLIEAFSILQTLKENAEPKLHLYGSGAQKKGLMEHAARLRLENIHFYDPVTRDRVRELGQGADAFVLCTRDLPRLYRYGVCMNKIFDYMAMARPIVMTANAPANPLAEAGCGIVVPPENPAALAREMSRLITMPVEQRRQMGSAGRRAVRERYNYAVIADALAETLDRIVRNAHPR